ncbi:MAG: YitT family protein [Peptoniphilaceae bacterium]|nr:YitT family protein [Peptoniphilaceae bacterium]MDY6019323.1 YitT family protein [Anaerococcus sp.]
MAQDGAKKRRLINDDLIKAELNLLRKDRQKKKNHDPMPRWKEIVLMTFAAILLAFSSHSFKYPNHFVIGGVEGLSIILSGYLHLQPAKITLISNLLLLVLAYFIIGKKFVIRTGYVSILNSVTAVALDYILPLTHTLTTNKLLELILAVTVSAFASTILFHVSASSGGSDIVAIILKKYTNIEIGKSLLMVDSLLTIVSIKIFGIEIGLLSCLGLIMKGVFVDAIVQSFNTAKFFIIITSKPDEVGSFIRQDLNRSATVLDGKGLYKGKNHTLFMCVTNKYEAGLFGNFIKSIDPACFITIINTSQIIGKGFYNPGI